MRSTQGFTYLSLKTLGGEALFSGDADYAGTLDVIAELSHNQFPIAAYCLLSHDIHLLSLGNQAQAAKLVEALMKALTGSANHPLTRQWEIEAVNRDNVPQQLCAMHLLPCQRGLFSTPNIHKWNSHFAYANPAQAPQWLCTEPVWLAVTPRYSGRVRAYLHQLEQPNPTKAMNATLPKVNARNHWVEPPSEFQDSCARVIAERVLSDHQIQWQHLQHGRMARRKLQLAGLCYAIALHLDSACDTEEFLRLFNLSQEELLNASRTACREASQYVVTTATRLGQKPTIQTKTDAARPTKEQVLRPNPVVEASPTTKAEASKLDVDLELDMSYLDDLDETGLGFQAIEDQPPLGLKPLPTQ